MARCPECNVKLVISSALKRSDRFFCKQCHVELEIVDFDPLELEAVYDFEDDSDALDELEDDIEELDWDDEEEDEGDEEDEDEDW